VAPVLAGEAFALHVNLEIEALLLDALARSEMSERQAAERSVERALGLAEPHGHVWIVLTIPGVGDLLRAHPLHRTAHAAFLKTLLDQLAGIEPASDGADELPEPLSERELAVMRFLPTNLSAAEIGSEAVRVGAHRQDAHAQALREARRAHAGRRGSARPGAGPVGAGAARLIHTFIRIV
jgi:LuxR family transcriptional regulator, maltose regulon positive regulatory protein